MRLLVKDVWFLRIFWMSGRKKGKIISGSLPVLYMAPSLSVIPVMVNYQGTPPVGVFSHSRVP